MTLTDNTISTEARTKHAEYLLPGRVVGTQGRKFLITGVISGVNYSATEVKGGQLAGNFKLRRQASYLDFGTDEDLLARHENAAPTLNMGDTVRMDAGRYAGLVGVVAQVRTGKYLIAFPGKPSLLSPVGMAGVTKVEATLS